MNGTVVNESTWEGIHTIIIHLSLPRTNAVVRSQTSINESPDVEPYQEKTVTNDNGPYQEKPGTNDNEPYQEKPVTNGHVQKPLYTPEEQPPPSRFELRCHPRADQVCAELDAFFATYWPWSNEQARQKFIAADTNRWACWSLPLVRDDRIVNAVKVNTLLFLLDGELL